MLILLVETRNTVAVMSLKCSLQRALACAAITLSQSSWNECWKEFLYAAIALS